MNKNEALHILGLDEDATDEDIRIAYKETAQILHPDRFANNKKLADRATEQFKNLQEAYEFLASGRGAAGGGAKSQAGRAGSSRRAYTRADELAARLAGLAAARTQLVAQRDTLLDQRRRGFLFVVVGALVAVLFRRIRPLAALAGAAFVWGCIDLMSATSNLKDINAQLDDIKTQKQKLTAELEELE